MSFDIKNIPEELMYLQPIIKLASKLGISTLPAKDYTVGSFNKGDLLKLAWSLYDKGYDGQLQVVEQTIVQNDQHSSIIQYLPRLYLNKESLDRFYVKNDIKIESEKPSLKIVELPKNE